MERVYIYDADGIQINDPEKKIERINGLNWKSRWPGGYADLSGTVDHNILEQWAGQRARSIKVIDEHKTVYYGRLRGLANNANTQHEQIKIAADGWAVVLGEKYLNKTWADNQIINRLEWPDSRKENEQQELIPISKRTKVIKTDCGMNQNLYDFHDEELQLPEGNYIWKVTGRYATRSGEGISTRLYNTDSASNEWTVTSGATRSTGYIGGSSSGQVYADDTDLFYLRFYFPVGTYDKNDYSNIYDLVVYCQLDNFPSPTYTAGEIIEDTLSLKCPELSADYSQIVDPGLVLIPFITKDGKYEVVRDILTRALNYGDSSQNTYGYAVWDDEESSDGLPQVYVKQRAVDDFEWRARLSDKNVVKFSSEPVHNAIFNDIVVRYVNEYGTTRYITSTDEATLTSQASINKFGFTREKILDADKVDYDDALAFGERFLAYHEDELYKTSITIKGTVKNKQNVSLPASWVRAGDRLCLDDWEGGTTCFLRQVNYDAESEIVTCMRDLPPDALEIFTAQRNLAVA